MAYVNVDARAVRGHACHPVGNILTERVIAVTLWRPTVTMRHRKRLTSNMRTTQDKLKWDKYRAATVAEATTGTSGSTSPRAAAYRGPGRLHF